jgi:hypothetical protein
MRHLLLVLLILATAAAYAQSPQVTIDARIEEEMYHGDTCRSVYTLCIDRYSLKDKTKIINWFGNDTSCYDWTKFIFNEAPDFDVKRIAEQTYNAYVFNYKYSQQEYAFEKVFLFTITREKCGSKDTMKFYFPIRISSFVTFIKLSPVYFKPGVYDLTYAIDYFIQENKYLNVTLKDYLKFENYKKE